MEFSPQQDQALKDVDKWLLISPHQVYYLAGYAGTGKTMLAKYFAQHVVGEVLFSAFTGKAAHVLKQKGCPNASTIHQLIYRSKEKNRENLQAMEIELEKLIEEYGETPTDTEEQKLFELRIDIENERRDLARPIFDLDKESKIRHATLIIIDECSMVGGRMGEDLLSFGTKVLVLGDPAQLPPIRGGGFFTERTPDTMLTEIHRQAKGNPIIAMATRTREKELLPLGDYGSSKIVAKATIEEAVACDQILVGRNKTRKRINKRVRDVKGIEEPFPVAGDRLVCLRNNHDTGLLNGAIWIVEDTGDHDENLVTMEIRPDDGDNTLVVEAHAGHFLGTWDDGMSWNERKLAEEFDFGYTLTVHKAQGSQWDRLLIMDESDCFRANKWRWLYTGITRAAEELILVRSE